MSVAQHDMIQFAEELLRSLVGVEATAIPADPPSRRGDYLSGGVRITGAWTGTVLFRCTREMARQVTGALLDVAPDAATPDDLRDVLGELANILAGNVKPLLPGPSSLHPPFADTTERSVLLHCGEEVWLECSGEPFVVQILKESGAEGRAEGEG